MKNEKNYSSFKNINYDSSEKITKDTPLIEALKINPYAADILMRYGMGCTICPTSFMETIEDAAAVHAMDVDCILEDLNEDPKEYEKMGFEPFDFSLFGLSGGNNHFELPEDLENFDDFDDFRDLMSLNDDLNFDEEDDFLDLKNSKAFFDYDDEIDEKLENIYQKNIKKIQEEDLFLGLEELENME